MNLIDFGFQNSNLFQHMPLFDEISYVGHNQEKVRQYKAMREDQTCNLLALNFIRNDEKIIWDAVEDFLLLNDFSQNPIFDLQNETQQARIKKAIVNLIPNSSEFIPEAYIQDKHGARELLSGAKL
mgnify:CR=1 FL=1